MATWHHWGCCWVLWCGCVPLGPEGWGEGRWGTAGSGGRRGGFESCVVKKQTEELCLWLWQAPCMGWWMCEGVAGRGTDSHTLTKWWGKQAPAYSFIHVRFYLHEADYRAKGTASKGNKPCRKEWRLTDCTRSTYLKPSTFGMKRLGFGGSLWQRGTLTGRGLFLGAKKKQKQKQKKKHTTP